MVAEQSGVRKRAGAGAATAPSQNAAAAAAAATTATRVPTWPQRGAVAIYMFFIPVFVLVNLAMLCSRWTAVPWLLYTLYINLGPARRASKDGSWPKRLRK
jgi:hypothetical protein